MIDGADFTSGIFLNEALQQMQESAVRLSTGLMINSADDGASEMAMLHEMRAQIADLEQVSRNIDDGVSMLQTFEGASSQISDSVIRMKELAMQAMNPALSDAQKDIVQAEFDDTAAMVNQTASSTGFNGNRMLNVDGEVISITTGRNTSVDVSSKDLQIDVSGMDLKADPQAVLEGLDT